MRPRFGFTSQWSQLMSSVQVGTTFQPDERPYFFWEYEITDSQIHELLRQGSSLDKTWLITRILEYAKWEDIWHYLTPADIHQHLANMRFRRPADRELWTYALNRWSQRD
ncbi:MAG: hypothetical protein WAW03_06160 [Anaerolineae bacterium]|uniref:hypothetical protein n=1 Tax=Candidatus Amarolinea dominans TaxID=3140696 RepID=UPI001D1F0CF6|nr:hypothetical protein [Anaerolineae bacterium]MBK9093071.1 hypothetical protein [Anaerolineae bacterium]MBK9229815.1 hypothetical protein [Anaerolineae bacterium]